jgi:hypothetical protein
MAYFLLFCLLPFCDSVLSALAAKRDGGRPKPLIHDMAANYSSGDKKVAATSFFSINIPMMNQAGSPRCVKRRDKQDYSE